MIMVACLVIIGRPQKFVVGRAAQIDRSPDALYEPIRAAFKDIIEDEGASLTVMHHHHVLLHKGFDDPSSQRNDLMSITKSVASLLVGIAVDRAAISDIDRPINQYLSGFNRQDNADLTLRHVLDMRAGLTEFDHANSREVYEVADTVELAKNALRRAPAGSRWDYDNRVMGLIAGIIAETTHRPADAFAKETLFAPLGITDWFWEKDPTGNPLLMAGLHLTSADLAKLGQLVLNRGSWQGKQLLSRAWADTILRPPARSFYGLLWWLGLPSDEAGPAPSRNESVVWAQGYGHQYLFIDEASSLVIALLYRIPNHWDGILEDKKDNVIMAAINKSLEVVRHGKFELDP